LLLHIFTFDPGWVAPLAASSSETILFDGHCGLCHRFVRFAIAEDTGGTTFRYAPLEDPSADTVVVRTADGRQLSRSAAVLHVLERLGGMWRILAILVRPIPRRIRDAVYDGVAAIRHRLFARPEGACPL